MRLKEFRTTNSTRLNEVAFIPVALWGTALAGGAYQAYETYNDIEAFRKGEIDKKELAARIGTDAAFMVAGGVAGKAIQKGWAFGKGAIEIFKRSMAGKKAAKAAADAAKASKGAVKPGDVVTSKQGNKVIAGTDSKPTTVSATDPNVAQKIDKIKKSAGTADTPAGGAGAAAAGAVVKKADDAVDAAKASKGAVKKADDAAKSPGLKKGGAGAQALARGRTKMRQAKGKGSVVKGAGIAAGANQLAGELSDYDKWKQDQAAKAGAGQGGDLVYTGSDPTPPVTKFNPGGLGLKGEKKPMDSNSPVPTSKDPKLPKQNTTPLSQQDPTAKAIPGSAGSSAQETEYEPYPTTKSKGAK